MQNGFLPPAWTRNTHLENLSFYELKIHYYYCCNAFKQEKKKYELKLKEKDWSFRHSFLVQLWIFLHESEKWMLISLSRIFFNVFFFFWIFCFFLSPIFILSPPFHLVHTWPNPFSSSSVGLLAESEIKLVKLKL